MLLQQTEIEIQMNQKPNNDFFFFFFLKCDVHRNEEDVPASFKKNKKKTAQLIIRFLEIWFQKEK